jgi:RimJ/RimL family protein N-acetyltransferase
MAIVNFPKLFGILVNLRELSIIVAQDIVHLTSYNISRYLYDIPNPYTLEHALNFIKSSLNFAIEYKDMKKSVLCSSLLLVGTISLKNINLVDKKANLGYWIGEQYWGRGIATECITLVICYAFSELELEEVSAYVFPENKASIRVLEKNDMKKKGEVNEYHNGVSFPLYFANRVGWISLTLRSEKSQTMLSDLKVATGPAFVIM